MCVRYTKRLVVFVTTDFALGHSYVPFLDFPFVDYSPVSESQSAARPLP